MSSMLSTGPFSNHQALGPPGLRVGHLMDGNVVADESYEQIRLSFLAMGGGLWDYDIDADRLVCNQRWYEILGLDPAKTPITSVAEFQPWIHPDDVELATKVDLNEVTRLLAQDERYHVEFRIIRPSGEIRWLRSIACIVEDDASGHRRAVGCVTDITEFRAVLSQIEVGQRTSSTKVASTSRRRGTLTGKEVECLMWVSLGKTAWETAHILGKSRRTVEFHLGNAIAKLNAANKVHAAAIAIRLGLL
jgi:DNA-binding CsgD family transcriptional regulator